MRRLGVTSEEPQIGIIERILEWVAGSELVVVLGDDPGRDEMSGDGRVVRR
jgi:hypothetical protein